MICRWLFGLQICLLIFFRHLCKGAEWSYSDPNSGPDRWSQLPKSMCSGTYQSPIPLSRASSVFSPELKPIQIYRSGFTKTQNQIVNSGHSIVIQFPNDTWFVSFDGMFDKKYEAAQMHFHWGKDDERGSEHTIDGKTFPLEGHIVLFRRHIYPTFKEAESAVGGLAVLGIMHSIVDTQNFNETIFSVYQNFGGTLNPSFTLHQSYPIDEFDLAKTLNYLNPNSYYRYSGSLTTPPCTENVLWTVFTDPVPVTRAQLNQLRGIPSPSTEKTNNLYDNFRPLQPLNPEGQLIPRVVYRAAASSLPILSLTSILFIIAVTQFSLRF
ncbi:unnamed protein product [Trichobilharzia szidati]|nr:unnamed protein product [Trichobilharzia szidati]